MAKGYDKGRLPRGKVQGYYENEETISLQKLGEIVSDLYLATTENDIRRLWGSAQRLLGRTKAEKERIDVVIKERRIGALAKLLNELNQIGMPTLKSRSAGDATTHIVGQPSPYQEPIGTPVPASITDAAAPAPTAPQAQSHVEQAPSHDQLKHAMKAFRKRLKLTKLDDESKLGHKAMSSGRTSSVVAIMPPREYPQAVWEELAKQGKLRKSGGGFYQLVEGV